MWQSVIGVSLKATTGVPLIKPEALYMCMQNKRHTQDNVADMVLYPGSVASLNKPDWT